MLIYSLQPRRERSRTCSYICTFSNYFVHAIFYIHPICKKKNLPLRPMPLPSNIFQQWLCIVYLSPNSDRNMLYILQCGSQLYILFCNPEDVYLAIWIELIHTFSSA